MKRGHYRKAIFIVCYKKEKSRVKYLLLKRKLHWKGWEFPKGGIEKNETPLQAVIRELKEETGQEALKITNCNFSGKYKYGKKFPDRKGFSGQEFSLFSAELKSKKIKLDKKEHSACKWLEFNQAIKLLTWKNQKDCLKMVNKTLNRL